eukprot:CAMPEP_0185278868 /NCGR_PEP_ID=MMETSP1359-20130426/62098_1 /TAXON_ID=552665 /ORGANISM="Bigelowiella longifila, Strain CCMP242" /LENGTH=204 /DNA_ID=CAMNT_0027873535 /DNA_START=355 /DNA_END=969 /DNA_ORIENTATION=+
METNTAICSDPVTLGRVVIGLYGNIAPDSVTNFQNLASMKVGGYKGSVFQEIHRGDYILAGRQGRVKKGYVDSLWRSSNKDITNPKALGLRSQGLGTVSLLFQGGLTDGIGSTFSVSTSSSVSEELDEKSLVIGRVLEGMEVISQIDQIPTFRPSGTFTQVERSFNLIGGALGDQRAARARESWVKPKITVLIMDSGILVPSSD